MSITSINNVDCYRIILQPQREYFVQSLPDALSIYAELKLVSDEDTVWLSDMLPQDCLYKPMSLDTIKIKSDEEYKVLKRIKNIRYIHETLFGYASHADQLIKEIMQGEIIFMEQFMMPALLETMPVLRKEIHPECPHPVVYRVARSDVFDIYIGSTCEIKTLFHDSDQVALRGNKYKIVEVKHVNGIQKGKCFVIQAAYEVPNSSNIQEASESCFRVRYLKNSQQQVIRPGSIFDNNDNVDIKQGTKLYPYIVFMEGINE